MSNLKECPNCGREAEETFDSNWFPVHTCLDCGRKYCNECSEDGNCPECSSSHYSDFNKVNA